MSATAVVFAYHDVGCRCLSAVMAAGVRVALVVTHRDDPGETIWFASVERLAREAGVEVAIPEDPNDPAFVARLAALAPDFLFSFYYRRMLSPAVLATARRGAFNMHGSLLPKYRGRVPVNWAVLRGERETGATLHEMVAKPDAGAIVGQEAVPIGENDTAAEVFARVTGAAGRVLERALPALLAGTATPVPQDLAAGSYFGGRRPEDGRIDWARPAREVHDLVRAVAPPYPGAFTTLGGRPARVLRTWWSQPPALPAAPPGSTAAAGGRAWACCGDGRWLEIRTIQLEGEPPLEGAALASRFAAGAAGMGQSDSGADRAPAPAKSTPS
ncbi:MAG: formyltransferase [Burkholderiales bacterium]|nr:formyltransferase [Burkholderiales bacterium]